MLYITLITKVPSINYDLTLICEMRELTCDGSDSRQVCV